VEGTPTPPALQRDDGENDNSLKTFPTVSIETLRALKGYNVVFVPSKCPSDSTQVGSDFSD
jgi:hypothetical protein